MSTNELSLIKESGSGKMFNTGDDKIRVLQLQGSWREMGQQYGTLVKDLVDDIYESTVQALYDKQWTTEEEASELFGSARGAFSGAVDRAVHVVRTGDTLIRIAVSYGVRLADLLLHNGLRLDSTIYPGQQIRIP